MTCADYLAVGSISLVIVLYVVAAIKYRWMVDDHAPQPKRWRCRLGLHHWIECDDCEWCFYCDATRRRETNDHR